MPDRQRPSRRALLAAGALTIGAGLGACGGDTPGLRFATGPSGGTWSSFGTLLSGLWSRELDLRVTVLRTPSSLTNRELTRSGSAQLCMQSADIATETNTGALGLGQMYSDVAQVFVRPEAPYRRLAELRGKRIWIARDERPPVPVISRLLKAAGFVTGEHFTPVRMPVDHAFDAVARGEVEAFAYLGGVPLRAARSRRLRPLDLGETVARMLHDSRIYQPYTVPRNTYGPDQPPVVSVRVPNYLLATERVSAELTRTMLATLFGHVDELATGLPAAAALSQEAAADTGTVPLHPGALDYYRSLSG